MPVIMGRKTFESFGKALPGRTNIVITRQADWKADGVVVVNNLGQAVEAASATDAKEAFIIGGGDIFLQSWPRADKIYITRVHAEFEGDTFFPVIAESEWQLESDVKFEADEKHQYPYSFQLWQRRIESDSAR